MVIIDSTKAMRLFVNEIRDNFNIQEKIELARTLMTSIQHDHEEALKNERRKWQHGN